MSFDGALNHANKRDGYFFARVGAVNKPGAASERSRARPAQRSRPHSLEISPCLIHQRTDSGNYIPGSNEAICGALLYAAGGAFHASLPLRLRCKLLQCIQSGTITVPCPHSHFVKVLIQHLELTAGCSDPTPPNPRRHQGPIRQKRTMKGVAVSGCPVTSRLGHTRGEPKSHQSH